jgi:hypothetical protein
MAVNCTYGTSQTVATVMGGGASITANTILPVCIPLAWVNPFFSSSRLIPTQSIGTIRLEMLFAPAVEALIGAGASYQIQKINVVVDTYVMQHYVLSR